MKFLGFLFCISFILIAGCADTIHQNNFFSIEKIRKRINDIAKDRIVKVEMNSGKTYAAKNLSVREDSTIFLQKEEKSRVGSETTFSKVDVKNIEYQYDPLTGGNIDLITLNTGRKILGKELTGNKDSIYILSQLPVKYTIEKKYSFSTSQVKLVSYNDRFQGALEYAFAGAIAGYLIATHAEDATSSQTMGGPGMDIPPFVGSIALGLAGAIVGIVPGSVKEYYLTNQSSCKGITSFGIIGGLNSTHFQSSLDNVPGVYNSNMPTYSIGGFFVWSFNNELALRTEITYSQKSGKYYTDYLRTVYLNFLEIPVSFQYSIPGIYFRPRLYAGPELSFFLSGRTDQESTTDGWIINHLPSYQINSNDVSSPDLGAILGIGINLNRYITFDIRYDAGLTTLGSRLFNGEAKNLKQNTFSFMLGLEY